MNEQLQELLYQLREKAHDCGNNREGRARKGAYVDCIVLIGKILTPTNTPTE
jgi:hypothetical protein